MIFKETRSGGAVYLFDRTTLKYEQGVVKAVGLPHADVQPGSYGKMLVDITVQTADGRRNTYSVSDCERTAYAGNLLIACEKESIVDEVRAVKTQAEELIANIDGTRNTIERCKVILEELDDTFKDKRETERRFEKIDEKFSCMEEKIDRLLAAIGERTD